MQKSFTKYARLLTPSWTSGVICVMSSLILIIGTIVASRYRISSLHEDVLQAQHSGEAFFSFDFQTVTSGLAQNSLIGNLPLFIFWAALGVIVYLFATNIWSALSSIEELREELCYINAPKTQLIRTAVINLLVCLMALVAWILYVEIFLKMLIPYSLAASHVAASDLGSAGYAFLAFGVLAIALHLHVTFLRLIWLRVRLFG